MLGFVQNLFEPRANPIGIDFGSDCLRLAQVQYVDGDHKLVAAASVDVPPHVRHDAAARLAFFADNVRDLLSQAPFRGRQAVLALPASTMHIQHLRMNRMDEAELKKAIPWEARGKLPIDPSQALLRHVVAGEIYLEQEPRIEVIVMAAARDWIHQFLATAAKSRLDIIGMNVEPMALVDCFSYVYRRKADAETTQCFVDIGASGTRAIIARDGQILFARAIPIGGDHFTRAVSNSQKIGFEDAKTLRIKVSALAPQQTAVEEKQSVTPSMDQAFPLLGAGLSAQKRRDAEDLSNTDTHAIALLEPVLAEAVDDSDHDEFPSTGDTDLASQARVVEQSTRDTVNQLVGELDLCRRYYESTFPNKPVERLIFIGGEARQRSLCQHIARELGIAAQVGDPLCRMGRISEISIESGIDRRLPQPAWAVAIGLSMGKNLPEQMNG